MSSSHTVPLKSQVGGHAGVQTTEDGSLIIKPALPLEQKFYQDLTSDERFHDLRPFVPKFFGTLKLEGEVDYSKSSEVGGIAVKELQNEVSIVLENLSHPFRKPNILDVKLGTVLYGEDASPEKVERMEKTARETTSFESGIRLTGFQVYDNSTSQPVVTPKAYGKSIKVSDLPEGIRRVFPIASSSVTEGSPSLGLPAHILLPILQYLRTDLADLRKAFAELELRMVGGSILIVYEADIAKAEEDLKWISEDIDDDDDEEEDDDDDEDDADGQGSRPGPPYTVKLIDFAHTRIKPGEGPDEGVLKGIDTLLRLVDGRIGEVERLLQENEPM